MKNESQKQSSSSLVLPRRGFLRQAGFASAALAMPSLFSNPAFFENRGRFAEELLTPTMTEGPFYPDSLPLDTDNDLLILNDSINPAIGEITHLHGTVRDQNGNPVRNAVVEIWQCDGNGVYLHSRGGSREQMDSNFQGFGRFTTGVNGEYYFRTIKPVTYPGRTPHIHFAVNTNGHRRLTTQMLINGHEQNEGDGLFKAIRDPELRNLLLVDFNPIEGSSIGELSAQFDMTIGITPDEDQAAEQQEARPEIRDRQGRGRRRDR
ncbi:MAG: protocatechuate 3,4-dioxygenase [Planctomycetota bacterium]